MHARAGGVHLLHVVVDLAVVVVVVNVAAKRHTAFPSTNRTPTTTSRYTTTTQRDLHRIPADLRLCERFDSSRDTWILIYVYGFGHF